jgi:hypothetical protein
MAGGGQFRPGEDPRRGTTPPPPKRKRSLMELARAERTGTVKALVRLRDQKEDPRIALQAAKLLMQYADGDPGAHNVPPPAPEGEPEDLDTSPPELSPDLEATLDESARRGGDAGDMGQGNGGGA